MRVLYIYNEYIPFTPEYRIVSHSDTRHRRDATAPEQQLPPVESLHDRLSLLLRDTLSSSQSYSLTLTRALSNPAHSTASRTNSL